jgi:hypothetical protein
MSLPTDDKGRKALPIFTGPLMYFPDALLALAAVCKIGNDQHNPGEPLHWARHKSTDQLNTALRHMMDHGTGTKQDIDGAWHLAKAAWRILAELQLTIEEAQGRITRDKHGVPHAVEPEVVAACLAVESYLNDHNIPPWPPAPVDNRFDKCELPTCGWGCGCARGTCKRVKP